MSGHLLPDDSSLGRGFGRAFTTRIRLHGPGVVVVEVAGDLDFLVTPDLRQRLIVRLEDPADVLVVDLSGVTLMSAAAIEVLVDVVAVAESHGTDVRVVAAGRAVLHPLQITGVDRQLRLFPSVSGATLHS